MTLYAQKINTAMLNAQTETQNFDHIGGVIGCMADQVEALPVITKFYDLFHTALAYQPEFHELVSFYRD